MPSRRGAKKGGGSKKEGGKKSRHLSSSSSSASISSGTTTSSSSDLSTPPSPPILAQETVFKYPGEPKKTGAQYSRYNMGRISESIQSGKKPSFLERLFFRRGKSSTTQSHSPAMSSYPSSRRTSSLSSRSFATTSSTDQNNIDDHYHYMSDDIPHASQQIYPQADYASLGYENIQNGYYALQQEQGAGYTPTFYPIYYPVAVQPVPQPTPQLVPQAIPQQAPPAAPNSAYGSDPYHVVQARVAAHFANMNVNSAPTGGAASRRATTAEQNAGASSGNNSSGSGDSRVQTQDDRSPGTTRSGETHDNSVNNTDGNGSSNTDNDDRTREAETTGGQNDQGRQPSPIRSAVRLRPRSPSPVHGTGNRRRTDRRIESRGGAHGSNNRPSRSQVRAAPENPHSELTLENLTALGSFDSEDDSSSGLVEVPEAARRREADIRSQRAADERRRRAAETSRREQEAEDNRARIAADARRRRRGGRRHETHERQPAAETTRRRQDDCATENRRRQNDSQNYEQSATETQQDTENRGHSAAAVTSNSDEVGGALRNDVPGRISRRLLRFKHHCDGCGQLRSRGFHLGVPSREQTRIVNFCGVCRHRSLLSHTSRDDPDVNDASTTSSDVPSEVLRNIHGPEATTLLGFTSGHEHEDEAARPQAEETRTQSAAEIGRGPTASTVTGDSSTIGELSERFRNMMDFSEPTLADQAQDSESKEKTQPSSLPPGIPQQGHNMSVFMAPDVGGSNTGGADAAAPTDSDQRGTRPRAYDWFGDADQPMIELDEEAINARAARLQAIGAAEQGHYDDRPDYVPPRRRTDRQSRPAPHQHGNPGSYVPSPYPGLGTDSFESETFFACSDDVYGDGNDDKSPSWGPSGAARPQNSYHPVVSEDNETPRPRSRYGPVIPDSPARTPQDLYEATMNPIRNAADEFDFSVFDHDPNDPARANDPFFAHQATLEELEEMGFRRGFRRGSNTGLGFSFGSRNRYATAMGDDDNNYASNRQYGSDVSPLFNNNTNHRYNNHRDGNNNNYRYGSRSTRQGRAAGMSDMYDSNVGFGGAHSTNMNGEEIPGDATGAAYATRAPQPSDNRTPPSADFDIIGDDPFVDLGSRRTPSPLVPSHLTRDSQQRGQQGQEMWRQQQAQRQRRRQREERRQQWEERHEGHDSHESLLSIETLSSTPNLRDSDFDLDSPRQMPHDVMDVDDQPAPSQTRRRIVRLARHDIPGSSD